MMLFFNSLFVQPCLITSQFTYTSTLGATSGLLMILYYFESRIRRKTLLITGTLLTIIALCIREFAVLVVFAIVSLYIFCDILVYVRKSNEYPLSVVLKKGKEKYLKELLYFVILAGVLIMLFNVSEVIKEKETWYRDYKTYNTARANMLDYLTVSYEGNEEFYSSIDILSKNDFKTLMSWSTDSDFITAKRMEKVTEYSSQEEFKLRFSFDRVMNKLQEVFSFIPISIYVLLSVLTIVGGTCLFVLYKIRNKIPVFFPLATVGMYITFFIILGLDSPCFALILPLAVLSAIVCFIFNRYQYIFFSVISFCVLLLIFYQNFNRINFRTTFVCLLPTFVLLIFSIDFNNFRISFTKKNKKWKMIYSITMSIIMFLSVGVSFPGILRADNGKVYSQKNIEYDLCKYIQNDTESLYVTDASIEYRLAVNYDNPIKTPKIFDNVLDSGWRVGDETQIQVKEKFHIKHLYREMTERNDIYYVMNPSELERMEEYFNNHYCDKGYKIVMTQQQIIDGCGIYSVDKVKI